MYQGLSFHLGETIGLLRDSVRQFAEAEIAPRAAEIDERNNFPMDLWPKMGQLGILGMTVSEEYGGAAMGYLYLIGRDRAFLAPLIAEFVERNPRFFGKAQEHRPTDKM